MEFNPRDIHEDVHGYSRNPTSRLLNRQVAIPISAEFQYASALAIADSRPPLHEQGTHVHSLKWSQRGPGTHVLRDRSFRNQQSLLHYIISDINQAPWARPRNLVNAYGATTRLT